MEASQTTDLDRERSVGGILRVSLDMYRRYPLLFAVLAVGVIAPYELARLAITGAGPFASGGSGNSGAIALFDLLNFSLVGPLISALHVHAVVEIGEGHRPKIASVAMRGMRVLPVVAAAEIVANLLIALGLIAFVIPGVLLALRWSVVAQTAAIDHEGWLPSLRRSRQLTAGHYGHIFGLLFVVEALTITIAVVAGIVFAHTGTSHGLVGGETSVGSVLVGIAVHTITASFMALTLAILYFDLRARETGPERRSIPEYQDLRDLD